MIKVGQIYKQQNGEIFVITQIFHLRHMSVVYPDGYVQNHDLKEENENFLFHRKIAEYPTWREAVNSKEFNEV